MVIKNQVRSFLSIMLTDPSLKRLIIFSLVSGIIWFIPFHKAILYIVYKSYNHVSLSTNQYHQYLTNIIVIATYYYILSKKNIGGTTKEVIKNKSKLKGKRVLITGGYKGIGLAAAKEFLKYGSEVILACRSLTHMELVRSDLLATFPSAKIKCVELELGSFKSIENCAKYLLSEFPRIDIIVNNAGFLKHSIEFINRLESSFFINYYGHFYLNYLLHDLILLSDTLIVNLSSIAHCMIKKKHVNYDFIYDYNYKKGSNSLIYLKTYAFSKLCMLYFTQQLQIRLEKEKTKACTVCINPGIVRTDLFKYDFIVLRKLYKHITFTKTPLQGAQTILYVCLLDREELKKGCYYSDCKLGYVRSYAVDKKISEELWEISEEILRNKEKYCVSS